MAKYRKNGENTDGEETVFFQAAKSGKSTDQYDTQKLSAEQVRRRAAQQNATRNPYASNYYTQNDSETDIYTGTGYPQNGYRQNGNGQNNSGRNSYGQNYRPQRNQGQQYRQGQRSTQNRQPVQRSTAQNKTGNSQRQKAYANPSNSRGRAKASKHRRQKKSLLYRVIKFICVIIVALFLLYSAIALLGIVSMNHVDTGTRTVTNGSLSASYVKNVLVIGTDSRDPETDAGRSDSMILVSINSRTGEIYMTSFLRDAYVEIPGNGSGKLNAAYSYGGAELLMDTLEYNYDIEIDDYVMFTFEACADVIDAVGGVELTISDEEAEAINEILISEVNEIMGDDIYDDLLDGGGTLTLDGKQALSYSRIRYVGNADFERTERQRTVMQQVLENIMKNPLRLAAVCISALPEMTTNMSVLSLYRYAVVSPVQLLFYDLEQQRIPADGTYSDATINGESVLQVDFSAAQSLLEETVFADN